MSRIVSFQAESFRTTKSHKISAKSLAALSAAAAMVGFSAAAKADTFGNNWAHDGNVTLLNSAAAWVDETAGGTNAAPPGASDIAQFDSNTGLSSPTTFNLGQASTTWGGLSVLNPGAAVTIDDSGLESSYSVTLGATGINVGSQGLTINDGVSIGASQTWNVGAGQTLNVNGAITGAGTNTVSFAGAGTTVLTGASSDTDSFVVNGGNLVLNFAAAGAPASNIINSGASLQLGGGSLTVNAGATSPVQSVVSTNILPGVTTINLASSGGGVPTFNLGSLSYAAASIGAAIVINGVPVCTASSVVTSTPSLSSANGTLTLANPVNLPANVAPIAPGQPGGMSAAGLLVAATNGTTTTGGAAFATVGLYDWAAVTGTAGAYQIVGGSTLPNFYFPVGTVSGTGTLGIPVGTSGTSYYAAYNIVGAANITNQFSGNLDVIGNTGTHNTDTIDSIRFNAPGTILVSGVPTLTLTLSSILSAGGILVTPNVGASDITIAGTAQDIGDTRNASGGAELMVFQNNTLGLLNIATGIGNEHGSDAYVQTGAGAVVFTGVSAYLGGTYLNGGATEINADGDLGAAATPAPIFLQGGAVIGDNINGLFLDNGSGNGTNARPITLANAGGSLAAITGTSMTVDGLISGSGTLEVGYGTLPGTGANTAHTLAQVGSGTVIITGSNSFTGGTVLNHGVLQVDNQTGFGLGTGSVTVTGGSLYGTGVLGNNVTVQSGGTITPGDTSQTANATIGNLTVKSLALDTGSTSDFQFGSGVNSQIIDQGVLTDQSSSGVDLNGPTDDVNGTYDLYTTPDIGGVTPANFVVTDPLLNGRGQPITYTFGTTGTDVTMTITNGVSISNWNVAHPSGTESWVVASNWNPQNFPENPGDQATLGTVAQAPTTIGMNQTGIAVGVLTFDNSNAYTLVPGSPAGNLTMQNLGIQAPSIGDLLGQHVFDIGLVLNGTVSTTTTNTTDSLTFNGPISGAGGFSATGPGTLYFNASNTYSGNTTIVSASGTNATIQVGNGSLAGTVGSGNLADQGNLIIDNPAASSMTISGAVTGAGTFTVNGGTVVLSGAGSTFSGAMNLNAGTVQVANAGGIGTPAVTFGGNATLDMNGNNVALSSLSSTGTSGVIDNVSAGGTVTLTLTTGTAQTFSGVIQNTTGTLSVVMNGTGSELLNNTNNYTGTTTITTGVLAAGVTNAIPVASTIDANASLGLVLEPGVTISSPIVIGGSLASPFVDVPNGTATLAGNITLAGSQYRPSTSTSNGTLILTGVSTAGTASFVVFQDGQVVYAGTGGLVAGTTSAATSGPIEIGRSSATQGVNVTFSGNSFLTDTNSVSPAGAALCMGDDGSTSGSNEPINMTFTMIGNPTVNLGVGGFDLDNDPLASGPGDNINLDGGTLSLGNFISTQSDASGITMDLNGTTIVATANDNANGTAALFFPNLSSAGLTANVDDGGLIINPGGFSITIDQSLGNSGNDIGGLTVTGSGTLTLSNQNNYGGLTTIGAGATLALANGSNTGTVGQGAVVDNGVLGFNYVNTGVNFNTNISGLGSVVQEGSGQTVLGGTNTYKGATNITNGTLTIGASSALPAGSPIGNIGTLDIEANSVAGKLSGTGALVIGSSNASTLQLQSLSGASTVGSLMVNSGSHLDLTNNPLYITFGTNTDPIATIQGYLKDGYQSGWSSGEIMSSSVATLNAAHGHLYGIGYIDGALPPVNYAGAVPPAGTIEVLPTISGDATLSGTVSFYDFQVVLSNFGKSNQSWDQGDFDYAATVDFFDFQDVLSNFGSTSSPLLSNSQLATLNNFAAEHGTEVVSTGAGLSLVSVPEPASIGLIGAAGFGLLARRRRRAGKENC